jgi:hypothetical protein
MSRIVINSWDLAAAASLMENAAGEYQAIGAQVMGCDCGCMPPDVAATVDAVTAEVRSALQGIASELAAQASGLEWRSAIDQDGGLSAVGSASGGAEGSGSGSTMMVGGSDGSLYGGSDTGSTMSVGGFDGSLFATPTGMATMTVGGAGGLDFGGGGGGGGTISIGRAGGLDFGDGGGGGTMTVGGSGGLDFGSGGGGGTMTVGGSGGLDFGGGGGGGTIPIGGAGGLDFGGAGGGGTTSVGGLDEQSLITMQELSNAFGDSWTTLANYPDLLETLFTGAGVVNSDWVNVSA